MLESWSFSVLHLGKHAKCLYVCLCATCLAGHTLSIRWFTWVSCAINDLSALFIILWATGRRKARVITSFLNSHYENANHGLDPFAVAVSILLEDAHFAVGCIQAALTTRVSPLDDQSSGGDADPSSGQPSQVGGLLCVTWVWSGRRLSPIPHSAVALLNESSGWEQRLISACFFFGLQFVQSFFKSFLRYFKMFK